MTKKVFLYVVCAIGVATSLACIALSMRMNYLYNMSKQGGELVVVWAWLSVCFEAIKSAAPVAAAEAWRNGRPGVALASVVAAALATGWALVMTTSVSSATNSETFAGRVNIAASYQAAERELAEKQTRRGEIAVKRTPAEIEAAIAAVLAQPLRDGDRFRGTVGVLSVNCGKSVSLTADACEQIAGLRGEFARGAEAQRLDDAIEALRRKIESLREQGGAQDSDPGAGVLARLSGGVLGRDDVVAGRSLLPFLCLEFFSIFGLLIFTQHGGFDADVRRVAAGVTIAVTNERSETALAGRPVGRLRDFAKARLRKAPGKAVAVAALHADYCRWCADKKLVAMARTEFEGLIAEMAEQNGLRQIREGGAVYYSNIALVV